MNCFRYLRNLNVFRGKQSKICDEVNAEESRCFRAIPALFLHGEDHEPAPSGTEKLWVCSLLGFAYVLEHCPCILAGAFGAGWMRSKEICVFPPSRTTKGFVPQKVRGSHAQKNWDEKYEIMNNLRNQRGYFLDKILRIHPPPSTTGQHLRHISFQWHQEFSRKLLEFGSAIMMRRCWQKCPPCHATSSCSAGRGAHMRLLNLMMAFDRSKGRYSDACSTQEMGKAKCCSVRMSIVCRRTNWQKKQIIAAHAPHAGYSEQDFATITWCIPWCLRKWWTCNLWRRFEFANWCWQTWCAVCKFMFWNWVGNRKRWWSPWSVSGHVDFLQLHGHKTMYWFHWFFEIAALLGSSATDSLDLGSNHRAVRATYPIENGVHRVIRGWNPILHSCRCPTSYHEMLHAELVWRNKSVDSNGMVAECFVYGRLELHEHAFRLLNQRGVRQWDVLPDSFNAVLEHAMRKWKLKLINESLKLGQGIRLTMVNGQWSTLYAPLGSLFQAQGKCETISYIHYRLQKCKNSGSIDDHKSWSMAATSHEGKPSGGKNFQWCCPKNFSGVQPVSAHKGSNAKPAWATGGLAAMQNNGPNSNGVVSTFQTKVCISIVTLG